jgi:transcriptional regulator with AAA-type ATPase domain
MERVAGYCGFCEIRRNRDKGTLELFRSYDWPGNIRELQNVVEKSVIVSSGDVFCVDEAWLSTETRRAQQFSLPWSREIRILGNLTKSTAALLLPAEFSIFELWRVVLWLFVARKTNRHTKRCPNERVYYVEGEREFRRQT